MYNIDEIRDTILQGHCIEQLRLLPDNSVNCVVTSPPYWGLRDYHLPPIIWSPSGVSSCNHDWSATLSGMQHDNRNMCYGSSVGLADKEPNKPIYIKRFEELTVDTKSAFCTKCGAWRGQLGLEPDFRLYIAHLLQIFTEIRRVLTPDGSCWVNLGDTYYTKSGGNYQNDQLCSKTVNDKKGISEVANKCRSNHLLQSKTLVGIPDRFKIAMIDAGWICRNDIIWHKRNCLPSSTKDRFTNDYERFFFFTKSPKYFFVTQYEPYSDIAEIQYRQKIRSTKQYTTKEPYTTNFPYTIYSRESNKGEYQNNNPRKNWGMTDEEARAVYNGEGQKAYTNEGVQNPSDTKRNIIKSMNKPLAEGRIKRAVWTINTQPYKGSHFAVFPTKLVETPIAACCPPHGLVLDPFFGRGTVGKVARAQGKHYLGIELNPDYVGLAEEYLGLRTKKPLMDFFPPSPKGI